MGADDSHVVYPYIHAYGGGRLNPNDPNSSPRLIRATWPFIVIYTIFNDTNQSGEGTEIYAVLEGTADPKSMPPTLRKAHILSKNGRILLRAL